MIDFFTDEDHRDLVNRLVSEGLQFELIEDETQTISDSLEGKTVVVSGVFEIVSRNELKKLIELNGGKVGSSISSKTSYLVVVIKWGPVNCKKQKS